MPSRAVAAQAQVRPHPRVHAPGRQEGHGPARRGSESRPQGRRGAAARRHDQVYVSCPSNPGGLARLGHAQREHEALLPPGRKLSRAVRGRGGRARASLGAEHGVFWCRERVSRSRRWRRADATPHAPSGRAAATPPSPPSHTRGRLAAYAHGTEAPISGNVDRDFRRPENRARPSRIHLPERSPCSGRKQRLGRL